MIKAIIFDLNGIFIQSEKLSDRFERDFNISREIFLPRLSEIMGYVRTPNALPAFSYWEPVLKEWGIALSEKEFWDYWFTAETPSPRMIEFARLLRKKGIKVYILSNNFRERAVYYGHYPWMHDAVDAVYFSWQTGFIKPDIKAWDLVLKENNLKGDECLYFDDLEKNMIPPASLGIQTFMFTNEDDLESIINKKLEEQS